MSTNSKGQGKTLFTCKSEASNHKLDCKPENLGMVRKKLTYLKINAGPKKLRKPITHEYMEACQKLTTAEMQTNSRYESSNCRAQASCQSSTISNVTSRRKTVRKTLTKKFRSMKNFFTRDKVKWIMVIVLINK